MFALSSSVVAASPLSSRARCAPQPSVSSTQARSMKPMHTSRQDSPRLKSPTPPGPPMVVADEPTRLLLHSHLGSQLQAATAAQLFIKRGAHGPSVPLDDPNGDLDGLLGADCGHRQGVVRRIDLSDGGSITLRPNLKGPVHPTVIYTARSKYSPRPAM